MTNKQKIQIQLNRAIYQLKNKSTKSTFIERWFLLDEATKKFEKYSEPLILGKGLEYILERVSTPIDQCDILVGRYIDRVPTESEETALQEIWASELWRKNPIVELNVGHRCFDWETLVKIGIVGYIERTQEKIDQIKSKKFVDQDKLDFYNGMLCVYKAVRRYIERYSIEAQRLGKSDIAKTCENITLSPPSTFKEAVQLLLFVYTVYTAYAGNIIACLSLGRMDNYLLPFYLKDIEEGILTEDSAGDIIDDFTCKLNLHLGRGEHQLSTNGDMGNNTCWYRNPSYDSPTYIVIDGYVDDFGSTHCNNPLTRIFVSHINPKLKEPVYIYRWTKNRSDEVWNTVCGHLRNNASILVYNDQTMIPAMQKFGVERKDAIDYTIHACNWPDISGGYYVAGRAGEPIPQSIMNVLFNEDKSLNFSSIDCVYEQIGKYYYDLIAPIYKECRKKILDTDTPKKNILSFDDCFLCGPFERGYSLYNGGVKYIAIYNILRNIGTATDIMSAIDTLIFKQKKLTFEELRLALQNNFDGFDDVYALCKNAPKFGTNNANSDSHAVRLLNTLIDVIDKVSKNDKGERDIIPLNVTISDMDHILDGKKMPATPDGRLSGQPLSENLSPFISGDLGITAVLNSVSQLPFDKIHGGAHNIRLSKNVVDGDRGLSILKALLDTYFINGGMQIQLSVADTKMLIDAQNNPQNYKDLMVRVTGYSALFTDMSKKGQNEIIRRNQMG